jgi:hypothetical protein
MTPTTRTFPRTTAEAFNDADRAACISGPHKAPSRVFWPVLAPVIALAALAAAALITFA